MKHDSRRTPTTVNRVEVDALKQDTLEVLCLIRSIKNPFAPINRIPPEIPSLIPNHCDVDSADQDLITLTHVCRGWRKNFTSCSSLRTDLDFRNVDKTCTYIQRSKSSPLEMFLDASTACNSDISFLALPHIPRLESLTVRGDFLPNVLKHFGRHTPLLEKLDIDISPVL